MIIICQNVEEQSQIWQPDSPKVTLELLYKSVIRYDESETENQNINLHNNFSHNSK